MRRLQLMRLERRLTARELARQARVSFSAITRIEAGDSDGSPLVLAALAQAFGEPISTSSNLIEDVGPGDEATG